MLERAATPPRQATAACVLSAVTLQVDNGTEEYTAAKRAQTTLVFVQTSVLSVTVH